MYLYGHKKEELGEIAEGRDIIELNERQKNFVEILEEREELTRVDYEKITVASKRTAIRDLNDLLIKKIVVEISTSETDPNKRYRLT